MNNVLLVTVLHRRYNLYEERDKQRLVEFLVFCSQTVIKDVVEEEEEEEEVWSTLTGKIKHNTGGAEDTGRGEGRTGFLCAVRLSYIHLSQSR